MDCKEAVRLGKVTKSYDHKRALDGLSLTIPAGTLTLITGPSGAGKTTLLNLMAGLLSPDEGVIATFGTLSMTFQPDLLFDHLSAKDNILYGTPHKKAADLSFVSSLCQCEAFLHQKTASLSAGQRQRVSLARALISEPDILLLDEPFSHMDTDLAREIVKRLMHLQRERNMTIVAVTHDPDLFAGFADQCVDMNL